MISSDTGMVFEGWLCEMAPGLKELTLPNSFSAGARSVRQSLVYILNLSSYSN